MAVLDTIPGALAAWSVSRVLKNGFAALPADSSGGSVSLIRDQIGSRHALASGAPAPGPGTINSNAYMKLDGTDDAFSFVPLALGTGDWTLFLAIGFPGAPAGPLIGHSTGAAGIVQSSDTTLALRSDSAGPLNQSTGWTIAKGFHILRVVRAGGTIALFQNGEAIGTPRALAGSFTLDQFGAAGGSHSVMGFGEAIAFGRLLSDSETTALEADMAAAWRSALHIDDTGGDDADTGWEPGSALKTIAAARMQHLRRGSRVLLRAGGTWRRDPLLFGQSFQTGTADAPIVIDAYGSGARPRIIGSTRVPGPFAAVTGTEYKKAVSLTNIQCVWVRGSVTVIRMVPGIAGSLTPGQYAYANGEIHFNFGAPAAA